MKSVILAIVLGLVFSGLAMAAEPQKVAENFQFNELDFDRQAPQAADPLPPPVQGSQPVRPISEISKTQSEDPDDLLLDLFTGVEDVTPVRQVPGRGPEIPEPLFAPDVKQGDLDLNLPGEPSPVKVPSVPGEAKIEVIDGVKPHEKRVAKRSAKVHTEVSQELPTHPDLRKAKFRWAQASLAWSQITIREAQYCQSLLAARPLYEVKCIQGIRAANCGPKNAPQAYTGYIPVNASVSQNTYVAAGIMDIRQFP